MYRTRIRCFWLCLILSLLVGALAACGSSNDTTDPPPPSSPDTTPNAFNFTNLDNAAATTLVESDPVTISGIDSPASVSITGGEYSIEDGSYGDADGTIENGQQIRVRVESSSESNSSVSATLTVGDVSSTFTVTTADLSQRVEAEAANPIGGATTVTDELASGGGAVRIGAIDEGISVSDSLDAETLILAYRSEASETLSVTVNDQDVGQFTLRPSDGDYATAALVGPVSAGETITMIKSTAEGSATETYIDYVEFTDSPFRFMSTVADTGHTTSDGTSVGPDGNVYVSGGPDSQNVLQVTPTGDISVFASGFVSANGSDFDSNGNLYVADYQDSSVRKITPEGSMTTFAASLDGPAGVWVDRDDNILVGLFGANFSGTGATVLSISPGGTVSTYASGGGLQDVIGVVGDENGSVYALNWNSGVVYEITGGTVTLLTETGGNANQVCYSNGYIYVPSPAGGRIRRVSTDGEVEAFVGSGQPQPANGPIDTADFDRPNSCDFSADGTVMYVMDRGTGQLHKIDAGPP